MWGSVRCGGCVGSFPVLYHNNSYGMRTGNEAGIRVWCVYVSSHPHTVTGLQRETEAIKMMSIRAGLLDISQSWATLGRKCNVLAESQRVRERGGGRE